PIARAAQPTTELPYTRKPEGNVIEFEVSNGLAIAYGDVILGRPDAGSKATRGYYETPTPQLWDKPEIPYAISPELPNPARVEKALDFFRSHTPVRFVPYEGQHDALIFEPGTEHCYSNLGKMGGLQTVKLAPGCQPPEIMHEIMHALGFVHEQSRPDRDRYVEILWSNIEEKYQSQFAIVPDVLMEAERGTNFDYHSIMLYQPDTFAAKPGLLTLKSIGTEPVAPARDGLSDEDVRRVKRLYNVYD
ncbi:MAG: M12 family metallopeptidase, partial [Bdellovibrionota bacterium]